ncbi:hypothetical protein BTVI_94231 [Pitangus sulphuratus]|nr:hypothetical protein BTVI_94231 [Pitangus sulphuratus]
MLNVPVGHFVPKAECQLKLNNSVPWGLERHKEGDEWGELLGRFDINFRKQQIKASKWNLSIGILLFPEQLLSWSLWDLLVLSISESQRANQTTPHQHHHCHRFITQDMCW